tara:strand:+ start:316 stop:495 length:180 start_codon:yes stop_codon:yes gene_type:complete
MKCTFCGEVIEKGTGKIYAKKDGKILNFCTTKCEKNMLKLSRKPIFTRWTQHFKKEKGR